MSTSGLGTHVDTTMTTRRQITVAALLVGSILNTASLVSAAPGSMTAGHTPTKADDPHRGFRVTGNHRGLPKLQLGSIELDRHGTERVVGARAIKHEAGHVFRLSYYTLDRHASRWKARHVQHPSAIAASNIFTALSPSGSTLITAVFHCSSGHVSTSRTPLARQSLRVPHLALSEGAHCNGENTPVLSGVVGLPHGRAALALWRFPAPGTPSAPLISIGVPGKAFPTPTELPNPNNISTEGRVDITRDQRTGQVLVSTEDENGDVFVWTKDAGAAWSTPTEVAAAQDEVRYSPSGITVARGHVFVGLTAYSSATFDPIVAMLATRSPAGQWTAPQPIPHTAGLGGPAMAANPSTAALHVVLARPTSTDKGPGLVQEALVDGTWGHYRNLLRTKALIGPSEVVLTAAGHPVVGYFRFR
jgi:hypothetical protein